MDPRSRTGTSLRTKRRSYRESRPRRRVIQDMIRTVCRTVRITRAVCITTWPRSDNRIHIRQSASPIQRSQRTVMRTFRMMPADPSSAIPALEKEAARQQCHGDAL